MARYANRTCYHCGAVHPQNEMDVQQIKVESGSSKKSVSALSILTDNNKQRNRDSILGLGGRTYYRTKTIYVCPDCVGGNGGESLDITAKNAVHFFIGAAFLALVVSSCVGGDDKSKAKAPTAATVTTTTARQPLPANSIQDFKLDTSKEIDIGDGNYIIQQAPGKFVIISHAQGAFEGPDRANAKCYNVDYYENMHTSWKTQQMKTIVKDSDIIHHGCEEQ